MDLFICRDKLRGFSGEELAIYLACESLLPRVKICDSVAIHLESICYVLYGDSYTAREKKLVNSVLKQHWPSFHNLYYVNINEFNIKDDEFFIMITAEEFKKLIFSRHNNRFNLLKTFCILLDTINYKLKVRGRAGIIGTQSISFLSDISGYSKQSIMRYITTLSSMNLITIVRGDQDGNLYSRKEDETYLLEYARERDHESGKDQKRANYMRSLTQRYNHMCKNPDGYSVEQIKELYLHLLNYNRKYPDKKKDLSPLRNYLDMCEWYHERDDERGNYNYIDDEDLINYVPHEGCELFE